MATSAQLSQAQRIAYEQYVMAGGRHPIDFWLSIGAPERPTGTEAFTSNHPDVTPESSAQFLKSQGIMPTDGTTGTADPNAGKIQDLNGDWWTPQEKAIGAGTWDYGSGSGEPDTKTAPDPDYSDEDDPTKTESDPDYSDEGRDWDMYPPINAAEHWQMVDERDAAAYHPTSNPLHGQYDPNSPYYGMTSHQRNAAIAGSRPLGTQRTDYQAYVGAPPIYPTQQEQGQVIGYDSALNPIYAGVQGQGEMPTFTDPADYDRVVQMMDDGSSIEDALQQIPGGAYNWDTEQMQRLGSPQDFMAARQAYAMPQGGVTGMWADQQTAAGLSEADILQSLYGDAPEGWVDPANMTYEQELAHNYGEDWQQKFPHLLSQESAPADPASSAGTGAGAGAGTGATGGTTVAPPTYGLTPPPTWWDNDAYGAYDPYKPTSQQERDWALQEQEWQQQQMQNTYDWQRQLRDEDWAREDALRTALWEREDALNDPYAGKGGAQPQQDSSPWWDQAGGYLQNQGWQAPADGKGGTPPPVDNSAYAGKGGGTAGKGGAGDPVGTQYGNPTAPGPNRGGYTPQPGYTPPNNWGG